MVNTKVLKELAIVIASIAILCLRHALRPSDGRRGKLVAWLRAATGREVAGVAAVWRDGRLLCAAVRSAVPGSCPAPDDAQLHAGLRHGQALAHKFLRVPPAFSEEELSGGLVTRPLERRLVSYLAAVQRACSRMALSAGPAGAAGAAPEAGGGAAGPCVVARGMGLVLAVQSRRAFFYLYLLRPQTGASDGEDSAEDGGGGGGSFHVHIVGPGGDFGSAVIPTASLLPALTVSSDSGGGDVQVPGQPGGVPQRPTARPRRGGRRRAPAPSASLPGWPAGRPRAAPTAPAAPGHDIPLDFRPVAASTASPAAALCVSYTPRTPGPHHLSIIWRGRHVPGSPFRVSVDESDGRSTPPAEAPRRLALDADVDAAARCRHERQRRVLLRVVDFVTDKKVLLEDGRFAEMTPAQQRLLWRSNTEDPNRSSAMLRRLLTEAAEERSLMDEVPGGPGSSPSQDSGDAGSEADARPAAGRARKLRRSLNIQQSGSEDGDHPPEEEAGVQRQRYRRILGLCSLLLRQQTPRRQSLEILSAAEHLLNGRPVRISRDTDRLVRSAICTLKAGVPDEDRRPSSAPSSVRYGIDGSPGEASGLNAISELEDPEPSQGLAGKGRTYFARSRCKDRAALPRDGDQALLSAEGAVEGPAAASERRGPQPEDSTAADGGRGVPGPDPKAGSLVAEATQVPKSYGSAYVNLKDSNDVQKELWDFNQPDTKLTDQIAHHYAGVRPVTYHLHTETTIPVPTLSKEVTTAETPATTRRGSVGQTLFPTDASQLDHQMLPQVKTPDLSKPTEAKGEEAEVVPGIVRERIAAFEKQPPVSTEEEAPTTKKIHICVHYIKPDEHTAKNGVEAYNNLSCCRADSPCTFLIAEDSSEDEAENMPAETDSTGGTLLGEANGENVAKSTIDSDTAKNPLTLTLSPGQADIVHNSSLASGDTVKMDRSTSEPHSIVQSTTQEMKTNDKDLSITNLSQGKQLDEINRPVLQPSGSLLQIDEDKLIDEVFRIFSEDSVESLDDFVSHSQLEEQDTHRTAERMYHSGFFGDVPNDERFDTVEPLSNGHQSVSLGEQGPATATESRKKVNESNIVEASGTSSVSIDSTSQLETTASDDRDLVPHLYQSVSLRVHKFETTSVSQNPTSDSDKALPSICSTSSGSRDITPQLPVNVEEEVQSRIGTESEEKSPEGEAGVEVLTEDDIDFIYQTSVLADTTVQTSADELFEELYESLHTEDEAEGTEKVNGNGSSPCAPVNEPSCQAVISSSDSDKSQATVEPATVNEFPIGDNMTGLDDVREKNFTSTDTKGDVEESSTVQVPSSDDNGGECLEANTVSAVEDEISEDEKQVTEPAAVSMPTEESLPEPSVLLTAEKQDESNVSYPTTASTEGSNSSLQEFSAKELTRTESFRESPTWTEEKFDIRQCEENSEEQNDIDCQLEVSGHKQLVSRDEADHSNELNEEEMINDEKLDEEQYEAKTQTQDGGDYDLEISRDELPFDESNSREDCMTVGGELKFDETVSAQQENVEITDQDHELHATEPLGIDQKVDVAHCASWSERNECEPSTETTKEETYVNTELICPDSQTNASSSNFRNKLSEFEDEDVSIGEKVRVSDALASVGELEENFTGSKTVDERPDCFTSGNIQEPGGMISDEVMTDVSSADEALQSESLSLTIDTVGETGVEEPLVGNMNEETVGVHDDLILSSGTEKSTCPVTEVSREYVDEQDPEERSEQTEAGRSDDAHVVLVCEEVQDKNSTHLETGFTSTYADETTMYELSPAPTVQSTTNNVSVEEVGGQSGNMARLEPPFDQITPADSVTGLQSEMICDDTDQVPTSDVSRDEHGMENLSEEITKTEKTSTDDVQPSVPHLVSSCFNDSAALLPSKLETEIAVDNNAPPENNEICGMLIDFAMDANEIQDNSVSQSQNYGCSDWFENSAHCLQSEGNTGSAANDILDFTAAPESQAQPETNFFDSHFDDFLAEKGTKDSEISQDFLMSTEDDKLMTSSVLVIPAVPDEHLNTDVDGRHPESNGEKEISTVEPNLVEDKILAGKSEETIVVNQTYNNPITPNSVTPPMEDSITEDSNRQQVLLVVETEGEGGTESSETHVSVDTKHFPHEDVQEAKFLNEEVSEKPDSEKPATQEGLVQKEMAEKERVDEATTVNLTPGTALANQNMTETKGNFVEEEVREEETEIADKIEKDEEMERKDMEGLENGEKNPETKYEIPETGMVEKEEIKSVNDMNEGEEDSKMVTEEIQGSENGKTYEEDSEMRQEEKLQGEKEMKGKGLLTGEENMGEVEIGKKKSEENEIREDEMDREIEMKNKMDRSDNENKLVVEQVEEAEIEKKKSEADNEIREEGQEEDKNKEWMLGDELPIGDSKEFEKMSEKNNVTTEEGATCGRKSESNPQLPDVSASQSMTESLLIGDEEESEFHLWPSDVPLGPPSGRSGLCSPVNAFDDSLVDFDSVIAAPSLEEALRQFEDGLERARLQSERAAQENCDSASSQYENTGGAGGRDNGALSEDANEYHSTPEGQYNSAEEQRAGDTADSGYLSTDDLHNSLHRSPDTSSISGVPRNKSGAQSQLPARCKPFQKFASDDKGRAGESGFMGPAEREIWGYQDDSDDESEWREGESTPVRYYPRVLTPGPPAMGPIAEEGEDGGLDGTKAAPPAAEGSSGAKPEDSPEQKVTSQSSTRASKPSFSSSNKSPDSFDDSDNKSSDNASLADNERSATPSDDSRDMSPQGGRDGIEVDHAVPSPAGKDGSSVVSSAVESTRGHLKRELSVPIIVIEDADLIDDLYTAFPPQIDRQVFSDSEMSDETKVKTRPRRRRLVYYDDTDLDVKKNVTASDASGKPSPEPRRKHETRDREDKSATSGNDSPSNSQATLDTDGDVSSSILAECADGTARSNETSMAMSSDGEKCSLDSSVLSSSKTVGNEVGFPEEVCSGETAPGNDVAETLIPEQDAARDSSQICAADGAEHPNIDDGISRSGVPDLESEEPGKGDGSRTVFEARPSEAPVETEDSAPLLSASNVTICIIGATPTPDILELEGEAEIRVAQKDTEAVPDVEDVGKSEEDTNEADQKEESVSESEPEVKVECTDTATVEAALSESEGPAQPGGGGQPAEAGGPAPAPAGCLAAVPVPSRVPAPVAQKRVSHWKQLWDVRCSFQKKRDRDGGVRRKRKSPSIRIPGIVSRWRKSFEASAAAGPSAATAGEGVARASMAGASATTRASRIRQWRQYWDGLASAEGSQPQQDSGAPRKLSKLQPATIALFDRGPRGELGTPDEVAGLALGGADLPAVSSWRFQSPTPPPSYQELVLSGVIKPPPPPAPRKKCHRPHVQRGTPPVPPHPTPPAQTSLKDSPADEPPTAGASMPEAAALNMPTITSFPTVTSSAREGPPVADHKMAAIAEEQQECTPSTAVTPEQANSIFISTMSISEGAGVTVEQTGDAIPIPPTEEHETATGEPRQGSITPEPRAEENKKPKPHVSSRYISAIGPKEGSTPSDRPKTSKAVPATKKARAQPEKGVDGPVKDSVRNVGPVKNVVIMPRPTADCPSYTAVYSTKRTVYKSGKMEGVEASAVSLGSQVETSQDLSKKVEPGRTLQERTGGSSSGKLATAETATSSRPSSDRHQKEKDKVSLAEFLEQEAQDFDREDLASVQKLSGLFDDKKAAAPKAPTPPRTPTRKLVARPAPVIAIVDDPKDSEVQQVLEVRVPVVRVLVEEEEEEEGPQPQPPSRRGSFSLPRETRSRPSTPTVATPRPWSPMPQPPAAAGVEQGAEEAESRNRFERARLFFQSLEKSQSPGSRTGSLDSAPPPSEAEEGHGTPGPSRRRRRSGDGGVAAPGGGGGQWEAGAARGGGPRWQSRLADRPGGSERLPRKVSERFHVRDLFRDVLGEGGVRGIPHQQAVLAALRSVESDGSRPVSPYEELAASGGISSPDPDPDPEPYPDPDPGDPDPEGEPGPDPDPRRGCSSPEPQAYLAEYPYLPRTPTRRFRPRPALLQPTLIPRRELLKTE